MTTVISIKDAPHNWLQDGKYVYIGRSGARFGALKGYFGNPYSHKKDSIAEFIVKTRDESVEKYKEYFAKKIQEELFRKEILKLKDKVLICFCKPLSCHGDTIAAYLNGLPK